MNSAENNSLRPGLRRINRQGERVPQLIGNLLDSRELVIVRQDNGVAFVGEGADLCLETSESTFPFIREVFSLHWTPQD